MKRYLLTILVFSLISICLYAEEHIAPSKIKEVTIYLQGARVVRTATVALNPGVNEIVFENLSNSLDENSIEMKGIGNATILSVNYRINYYKLQQLTEATKKLKFSMDSVKYKLDITQNELLVLDQTVQLLQANYKMGVNDKTQFVDDIEEWAQRYSKKVLDIKNSGTKLKLLVTELKAQYADLQNKFNQSSGSSKQPSGEIVVKVQTTAYGNADFNFAYYVGNASWTPIYSLRAQNTTNPIQLDYDALVIQQTGEIWNDIKMSLSTGNPTLGGNKPDLFPWYLRIQNPPISYGYMKKDAHVAEEEKSVSIEAYKSNVSMPEAMQNMSTGADYTTVKHGQLNVTFDINLRYTILPDGSPQQVRMQQISLPATFEYAAIPKLDLDAFLLAKVTGWEDNNLLPGNANLYFEGAYVGKSFINPSITNDTLNLSFGRDKKINIERKLLKDFSKKAFFGKTKTQNFVYEITVKNNKNISTSIDVEDQVPVSQTKDIEVSVKETSKADYDANSGKLKWKFNLQPNEVRKIKIEYSLKYPTNKNILGL